MKKRTLFFIVADSIVAGLALSIVLTPIVASEDKKEAAAELNEDSAPIAIGYRAHDGREFTSVYQLDSEPCRGEPDVQLSFDHASQTTKIVKFSDQAKQSEAAACQSGVCAGNEISK